MTEQDVHRKVLSIRNQLANLNGNLLQLDYIDEVSGKETQELFLIFEVKELGWYTFKLYDVVNNTRREIRFTINEVENFLSGRSNKINFINYQII